jgi:hypothetical protein
VPDSTGEGHAALSGRRNSNQIRHVSTSRSAKYHSRSRSRGSCGDTRQIVDGPAGDVHINSAAGRDEPNKITRPQILNHDGFPRS